MMLESFPALIAAYLETLRGRASHPKMLSVVSDWIATLTTTPTRAEILARQHAICAGHFQPNATKANKELALIRAACRWGLYQEVWEGGDPTLGVKKWKTPKRRRTGKFDELRKVLGYFDRAASEVEIRDRALYGLMLFTGCRPSEARAARLDAITPYGAMGCWKKGKTKTGEDQELPLPTQYMPWLAAWKAIRPNNVSPYLFGGQWMGEPMTPDSVRRRWYELRLILGIRGLWNYDLRRTLASCLSNDLKIDDVTIRAILNHSDTSALGHYCFKSFDSLTDPIQRYADWLGGLMNPPDGEQGVPADPRSPLPVMTRHEAGERAAIAPPSDPSPLLPPQPARPHPTRQLTGRERQILALFAAGRSYQQMADHLNLTLSTIGCYRARLLDRLQLATTGELVAFAQTHGVSDVPVLIVKRGRIGASDRALQGMADAMQQCPG